MSSPMLSHRPFLSLDSAGFRLGERILFENTTWVFHRDEHWAVLGGNGSGKSLFADALRGRLPLVQGEMRYHFRPPAGLSHEEAIGHVSFEDRKQGLAGTVVQSRWNSLEEEGAMQVGDYLSYERVMDINPFEVNPRHERERPQFDRRRRRAVALLRIEPFLDRALLSLSNGETQRVHLARALCHPLRLLILDEPFTGLDAATREHFHRVLEHLMGTPLRVLLITTRADDLPRQVTQVLWVEAGRVSQIERRSLNRNLAKPGARTDKLPRVPGTRFLRNFALRNSSRLPKVRGDHSAEPPRPALPSLLPARARAKQPLVIFRNVTVRYGATTILRDLTWTVSKGESWALLGPNGSGKTTLLSLILGDHPQAYANEIVVFGRQRGGGDSIWELKQHIGWVSPELHLHYTDTALCWEVVASGFHNTIGLFEPPTRHQRAAARGWLRRFHLAEFAEFPLFGLSAGLQRMVLLARAVAKRPRLLILDEPCQGLDAAHRKLFIQTVDHLIRSQGVTAIYVTHREDEIPPSIRQVLRLGER